MFRACQVLSNNLITFTDKNNRKCNWIIPSTRIYKGGVWNWDSGFHAMTVARWDKALTWEQCKIFLDQQDEKGMFSDAFLLDETNYDTISKPPVLPWVLEHLCKEDLDIDKRFVYERLKRNECFWRE